MGSTSSPKHVALESTYPTNTAKSLPLPVHPLTTDEGHVANIKRRRCRTQEERMQQEEGLKERRRVAAQSSRDRKAAYISKLEEENERLQHEVEDLKLQLQAYRASRLYPPQLPGDAPPVFTPTLADSYFPPSLAMHSSSNPLQAPIHAQPLVAPIAHPQAQQPYAVPGGVHTWDCQPRAFVAQVDQSQSYMTVADSLAGQAQLLEGLHPPLPSVHVQQPRPNQGDALALLFPQGTHATNGQSTCAQGYNSQRARQN